jgi:catechol 2,3-dioxygenase-like lactoylglutathione lyase family enzyme
MATRERHRGRLIDHIAMVVRDFAASKAFYTAVIRRTEDPAAETPMTCQCSLSWGHARTLRERNTARCHLGRLTS